MTGSKPPRTSPSHRTTRPYRRNAASGRAAAFDLVAFRERRFADGVRCPRCQGRSVHRWGRFGDRQRYRCLACPRTFSDLTGTPLAYLKRLDGWASFCDSMLASRSIRRSAVAVGVHPSTIFRWRHCLLDTLRAVDAGGLQGDVAVSETCFPFSEKGRRDLDRPPRRRGDPFWWRGDRAWVLLAHDDAGQSLAELVGPARPRVQELTRVLALRLAPGSRILDAAGPFGAPASLARQEGLEYRRLTGTALVHHPAARYGRTLRRWLARFRGVATKYLANYLAWQRFMAMNDLRRMSPAETRAQLVTCAFH